MGERSPGLAPGAGIKAPLCGLETQTSNQQGAGWAIDPGVDGMGLDRAACQRAADGWTQRSTPTVRVRTGEVGLRVCRGVVSDARPRGRVEPPLSGLVWFEVLVFPALTHWADI